MFNARLKEVYKKKYKTNAIFWSNKVSLCPINQIFMHLLQKKFVYHTFYQII